jgi:SAM-dependent methyltransferase
VTIRKNHFEFACPRCGSSLISISENELSCPHDGELYRRVDGIWRFLLPETQSAFRQFIQEYETVRKAEGRGSADSAYYRALPFRDLNGKSSGDWRIRARSYQALIVHVLSSLEQIHQRPLYILDLGAGNGWLSNRLSQSGHHLAAVDLTINDFDGLGAHIHYETSFTPVQADFAQLPFVSDQADLAIFNASFHYATSYERVLQEALRVIADHGLVVIMDTPVYHAGDSGEQMVREREAFFRQRYGFPSNSLPSQNFLTSSGLEELSGSLGIHWQIISPNFGLFWSIRRFISRLRARREPASFPLLLARPARTQH